MVAHLGIVHFNAARLLHPPGDPRVAEFVDNTKRVNALAQRSKGYIWHLADEEASVTNPAYEGTGGDPCLVFSMSVWESFQDFEFFVYKTIHASFLTRRASWFAPWQGPNYVVWDFEGTTPVPTSTGWAKLKHLADEGPSPVAYDLAFARKARGLTPANPTAT
ncbi:MAG: DUF3291 domain-containing protein [Alphaproteobacteria bacterium]|nr:DUF3291 domain-containing protein [Alphaproteobacteria bacterium]